MSLAGRSSSNRPRRGAALIYMAVAMTAFCGLLSLGVDLARAQRVKTELQIAADAAARNAAASLYSSTDSTTLVSNVRTAAKNTAAANYSEGASISISNSDVEFGTWTSSTKTFTVLSGSSRLNANAVRVTVARTSSRGNALPLLFGKVIGKSTCDVIAQTVAMQVPAVNVNQDVQSTGNPYLAGMPSGSVASLNNPHSNPDYADTSTTKKQSPDQVSLSLYSGAILSFANISGSAGNDPDLGNYTPDGNTGDTGYNYNHAENGIGDLKAPINSLVGVFLDATQPSTTAAPTEVLDFSTQSARDYTTLAPKLKQPFFIGDGKTSGGATQYITVPAGATRLYVVNWDYYEWNNNYGYRNIQISQPKFISIVN